MLSQIPPSLKNLVADNFFLIGLALSLTGCAAQGGPGGGPEDKTGPELLATNPPHGTVNVPLQPRLELLFSEPIEPRSADNLTVTPRLKTKPRVKVNRRKISIELAEDLEPNCTYLFNFGRQLQDYQGNNTAQEIRLAFATGDSLDDGIINGTIYDLPPNTKAYVCLFRKGAAWQDSLLKAEPDFIATADARGNYQFTNLPSGSYRALAVTNPRLRSLSEEDYLALPAFDELFLPNRTSQLANVNFRLTHLPLQPFRLLTANVVNGFIELNFSHAVAEDCLRLASINLPSAAAKVVSTWRPEQNPKQIYLLVNGMQNNQEYQIQVENIWAVNGAKLIESQTAKVIWKATIDTVAPQINATTPPNNSKDQSRTTILRIDFSEPIDTLDLARTIFFFENDTLPCSFSLQWLDGNSLLLRPQQNLRSATNYTLKLSLSTRRDRAGNAFRDSLRTIKFTTIDENKFGSVSGRVRLKQPELWQNVFVEANLVGEGNFRELARLDSLGNYRLEQLLPGKYLFSIWHDRNGNNQYDYGKVVPYQPAEAYRAYPTQINVRSRWETAEVDWDF